MGGSTFPKVSSMITTRKEGVGYTKLVIDRYTVDDWVFLLALLACLLRSCLSHHRALRARVSDFGDITNAHTHRMVHSTDEAPFRSISGPQCQNPLDQQHPQQELN